jgi:O-antigen ligase
MSLTLYIYIALVCYVVPILMPWVPKVFGEISLAWALFYILVLSFLVQASAKHKVRVGNTWTFILWFYLLIVFASISWAENYSYDLYNIERIYARFFAPLIIASIALNLFNSQENIERYIKNLILAAVVLSVLGAIQLGYHGTSEVEELRAGAGTLENPNALAVFLVLTIPCALYAIEKRIIRRTLSWGALLTIVIGILLTVSRKGYVAAAIAFGLYFGLTKQFRKLILLLAIACCSVFVLISVSFIGERFTAKSLDTNLKNKATMVRVGWEMFRGSPLIGLGYNGFYENFGKYVRDFGRKKYDAHNIYITELSNRGLLGFLPFISIFLYPLFLGLKTIFRTPDENKKQMAVISIASLLPFMVSGFFAGGLFWGWFNVFVLYTHISFIFVRYERRQNDTKMSNQVERPGYG